MLMGPDGMGKFEPVVIKSIHRKRLPVQEAVAGQAAAFALKKIKKNQVKYEIRLKDASPIFKNWPMLQLKK